ncbi:hypothetical protein QAD02_008098 [Eretmocerus hayati]|uniref:Uncharacterized protein n=1 Tax=Eretmocerus hayati TaxID=131215 RepID=A0ACC2N6B9_9HYME|nr:hypothetical protein QAD02_008098 [Eretmocerus hayati]
MLEQVTTPPTGRPREASIQPETETPTSTRRTRAHKRYIDEPTTPTLGYEQVVRRPPSVIRTRSDLWNYLDEATTPSDRGRSVASQRIETTAPNSTRVWQGGTSLVSQQRLYGTPPSVARAHSSARNSPGGPTPSTSRLVGSAAAELSASGMEVGANNEGPTEPTTPVIGRILRSTLSASRTRSSVRNLLADLTTPPADNESVGHSRQSRIASASGSISGRRRLAVPPARTGRTSTVEGHSPISTAEDDRIMGATNERPFRTVFGQHLPQHRQHPYTGAELLNMSEDERFLLDIELANEREERYNGHAEKQTASRDGIRIRTDAGDSYLLPYESFLYIGALVTADNVGAEPNFTAENCCPFFIFDENRLEINGHEIDQTKDPGIVGAIQNILTLTDVNPKSANGHRWGPTHTAVKNCYMLRACSPLNKFIWICEDFKSIILGANHELILIRSKTDNNCSRVAQDATVRLTLSKIQ